MPTEKQLVTPASRGPAIRMPGGGEISYRTLSIAQKFAGPVNLIERAGLAQFHESGCHVL
ncbi:MAG: hypothetical protein ACKOFI_06935 [Phycisphaerales bacterium]